MNEMTQLLTNNPQLHEWCEEEVLDNQASIDAYVAAAMQTHDETFIDYCLQKAAKAQAKLDESIQDQSVAQKFTIKITGTMHDLLPNLFNNQISVAAA